MGSAIPEERRQAIVERLRTSSLVKPAELAEELGVSVETIRRDLVSLEEDGLLRRVYGGATQYGRPRLRAGVRAAAHELPRAGRRPSAGSLRGYLAGDTLILDIGPASPNWRPRCPPAPRHRPHQLAAGGEPDRRIRGDRRHRVRGARPGRRPRVLRSSQRGLLSRLLRGQSVKGCGGVDATVGVTDYPGGDRIPPGHHRARGGALHARRLVKAGPGGLRQGL